MADYGEVTQTRGKKAPDPLPDFNYCKQYADGLNPTLVDLRSRRQPIEQRWLLNHSAWRGQHTRAFFKSDLFNHYIPAARRAIERAVKRGAQMLVPSAEFFEVFPGDEYDDQSGENAESVRAFQMYVWTKRIKPYPMARQLLRSYFTYGRAIGKAGLEVVDAEVQTAAGVARFQHVWPKARVVDPFAFYFFPETESDISRAQLLMEDVMMPWNIYEQYMDAGLVKRIEREKLGKPIWPDHHVRRLMQSGLNDPSSTQRSTDAAEENTDKKKPTTEMVDFLAISEVWKRKGARWEQCWILQNYENGPILVRENKKPFPVPPYRVAIDREVAGEQYTTGMMDDVEPLQVLLNDQVNAMLEGQVTNFAPPAAINPDMVTRADSIVFRPRAKWLVDPNGVKWLETKDTTKAALMGIAWTTGQMDSSSGSNALSEGTPPRNMPRAGFAVSSLLNLSMADIRDAAQMIEDQVLTPLLSDTFRIAQMYVPPKQIMRIPGTQNWPARRLTIEDLAGDWHFQWVGSLQFQDTQVRAQRLVATLGVLGKMGPTLQQELQAQGKRVNWVALLKRIWRDGLGERGADTIIEKIPQQDMQRLMLQQLLMAQAKGDGMVAGGGMFGPAAGQGNPQNVQEGAQRSMVEGSVGRALDGNVGSS